MVAVRAFTFNPYAENTYLVYDESKECTIFDPGCHSSSEQQELVDFIEKTGLKPVHLINTHGHIDHMMGNRFVADKYNLGLQIHKGELEVLKSSPFVGKAMGIEIEASPDPDRFIEDEEIIEFGNTKMKALLTPGHSPAHLCFLVEADNVLIGGDVLFRMSIGRTDLPGGDFNTLMQSIFKRLFTLKDETVVYPGHGESTTIGFEKKNNPFLNNIQSIPS